MIINATIDQILESWKKDYAWLTIETYINDDIEFNISKDTFYTIFDNLILNSVQQNSKINELKIKIDIKKIITN